MIEFNNTGWQNKMVLMFQKVWKLIPNQFWVLNPKKILISPNSRFFPRKVQFSAVFAILNRRNQLRWILIERILYHDDFAKEKMEKSWKLEFWWIFKVWNFEFLLNFSNFFRKNFNFFREICNFCYPHSFMIFNCIICGKFGEKILELPSKLKIW